MNYHATRGKKMLKKEDKAFGIRISNLVDLGIKIGVMLAIENAVGSPPRHKRRGFRAMVDEKAREVFEKLWKQMMVDKTGYAKVYSKELKEEFRDWFAFGLIRGQKQQKAVDEKHECLFCDCGDYDVCTDKQHDCCCNSEVD